MGISDVDVIPSSKVGIVELRMEEGKEKGFFCVLISESTLNWGRGAGWS